MEKEKVIAMKNVRIMVVLVALLLGLVFTNSSYAIIFIGDIANSTEGLGNFEAELIYNPASSTNAAIEINLKNTSPEENGGYITAFLLNNPLNSITGIPSWTTTDSDFNRLFVNDGLKGAPYGYFDFGASLGTNVNSEFADGGNPAQGIAVGDTETFTFNLVGTGLDGLTEDSFVNALSQGTGAGYEGQFFAVRFRGFENDGSDKVPGQTDGNGDPIPEPATLFLFGPALLGLAWRQFKKNK